jgi:hypothetical protein
VSISSCTISGNTASDVRAQNFPSPPWETHVLLVVCRVAVSMSRVAPWPSHRAPSVGTQLQMCALTLKRSHRPMGRWLTCPNRLSTYNSDRCLVLSGICTCQPRLQTSHRPAGEIADVLTPTHACTNANALVNYRGYVPQIPCKVPIAPMGKLLTCLCLDWPLTLVLNCNCFGQLHSRYVPQRPSMFPSPPCESHVLLVGCRAVVSQSWEAQWPSHRAPSVGTQHLCVLMFKSSHRTNGKIPS